MIDLIIRQDTHEGFTTAAQSCKRTGFGRSGNRDARPDYGQERRLDHPRRYQCRVLSAEIQTRQHQTLVTHVRDFLSLLSDGGGEARKYAQICTDMYLDLPLPERPSAREV